MGFWCVGMINKNGNAALQPVLQSVDDLSGKTHFRVIFTRVLTQNDDSTEKPESVDMYDALWQKP